MDISFLVVLLAVVAFFYFSNQGEEIDISSYQELIDKSENNKVSKNEVIAGANLLSQKFCNDVTFQTTGASTNGTDLRAHPLYFLSLRACALEC